MEPPPACEIGAAVVVVSALVLATVVVVDLMRGRGDDDETTERYGLKRVRRAVGAFEYFAVLISGATVVVVVVERCFSDDPCAGWKRFAGGCLTRGAAGLLGWCCCSLGAAAV